MHPKDIRHLSAGSTCLKQSPVVVPVYDVDLDLDAGGCRPLIGNLLQAIPLVVIPDIDRQFRSSKPAIRISRSGCGICCPCV